MLILAATALLSTGTLVYAPAASAATACGSGSYQAEAVLNGNTWTARAGATTLYTGTSTRDAIRSAIGGLQAGRTSKQAVVVRGSGSVPANTSIDLPSYTVLDVCGTLTGTGTITANNGLIRIRRAHDVEVRHLNMAGSVYFGVFIQNSDNVHLGAIDSRLGTKGMGIRVDNFADRSVRTRNITIDTVYASGGDSHGVETMGVDGITIGTVTVRNTGQSGVLLNDTINATIGTIDANGAGAGTGYAAFRMANRNGRINDAYPANIRVGLVKARGGGRGIFCVSESGGAVIDSIDIADTGGDSILLENCYGVTIAAKSGTVNGGVIRIASRATFPVASNITLQNLTVTNSSITEKPCGTNIIVRNITRVDSPLDVCS